MTMTIFISTQKTYRQETQTLLFDLLHLTVEPVLSGTVLREHLFLSGHLAKSRKFRNLNTVKVPMKRKLSLS